MSFRLIALSPIAHLHSDYLVCGLYGVLCDFYTEWGKGSQSGKQFDLHHGQNYVKDLPCS